jgi:hypothetical protein
VGPGGGRRTGRNRRRPDGRSARTTVRESASPGEPGVGNRGRRPVVAGAGGQEASQRAWADRSEAECGRMAPLDLSLGSSSSPLWTLWNSCLCAGQPAIGRWTAGGQPGRVGGRPVDGAGLSTAGCGEDAPERRVTPQVGQELSTLFHRLSTGRGWSAPSSDATRSNLSTGLSPHCARMTVNVPVAPRNVVICIRKVVWWGADVQGRGIWWHLVASGGHLVASGRLRSPMSYPREACG